MSKLHAVQWLTVAETADLWSKEMDIPASAIEREMRIALYKLEKRLPLAEKIQALPREEEMPGRDALVNHEFLKAFVGKQYWELPRFWFQAPPRQHSFPGRPSVMPAILQELEAIAERDELAPTLAEQARILEAWSAANLRPQQTPKAKGIENGIRIVYWHLKNPH